MFKWIFLKMLNCNIEFFVFQNIIYFDWMILEFCIIYFPPPTLFQDSTSDEEENIQISNKRQLQRETQVKKTLKHDRQTLHYDQSTGDFSITRDSTSLSYESSSHEKVENKVEVQITHRPNRPLKAFSQKNPEVAQLLPPKPQIPTKPTCSFIRPVIKGTYKILVKFH